MLEEIQSPTQVPVERTGREAFIQSKSLETLRTEARAAEDEHRWVDAVNAYRQIWNQCPEEKSINRTLGWVYFKWNKELIAQGDGALYIARRNLWAWLKLNNDKTERPYILMPWQARTLANEHRLQMRGFLKEWDLSNLQPIHWKKLPPSEHGTSEGMAIKVIRIAAKQTIDEADIDQKEVLMVVDWVNMALGHAPEDLWLTYYKGRLLLKLNRPKEAVVYLKSVVQHKFHEGWAWYYLAQALVRSGDELSLACACKAVAESVPDKSQSSRLQLLHLLVEKDYLNEAKAMIERMHEISSEFSVQLPREVENFEHLPWFAKTEPSDQIDDWINTQGSKALDLFTANLTWEKGCVGASFVNAKQKPRVKIVLTDGSFVSVSANAYGLGKMKEGDPIEIKKQTDESGRIFVLELRRRNGNRWDFTETTEAVVTNINKEKNSAYFVGFRKSDEEFPCSFYCPLNTIKETLGRGNTVRLHFIPGDKNLVVSVKQLQKSAPANLLKKVKSTVDFIAPNRAFGKLDNDVFLSNTVLASHTEITEESTISGIAIRNFDNKKKVWGWALLTVKAVINPN